MSRFEGLLIWQRARAMRVMIRDATQAMSDWELKDQMRSAALSVMSNIAEGSERSTDADFRRFLAMAHGSCGELRSQLIVALEDRWVDQPSYDRLNGQIIEVGKMIAGFMKALARGGGGSRVPTAS